MKRRRLTPRDVVRLMLWNHIVYLRCAECNKQITRGQVEEIEFDHSLPLALGGEDKWQNIFIVHRHCHKRKSGADIKRVRKADRQRRHHATGRSSAKKRVAKIQSRGFDKTLRKRMDGTVERRVP